MKESGVPSPDQGTVLIPPLAGQVWVPPDIGIFDLEPHEEIALEPLRELRDWLADRGLPRVRAHECAGRIESYYEELLIPKLTHVVVAITAKDWGDRINGVRLRLLWPEELSMADSESMDIMWEVKQTFRANLEDHFFPQPIMQLGIFTPNGRHRPFTDVVREWCAANGVDYFGILSTVNEVTHTESRLLTPSEVAQRLGIVRQRVHQMVNEGKLLPAKQQRIGAGGRVVRLFYEKDVEMLRQEQIDRLQIKLSRLDLQGGIPVEGKVYPDS